MPLICPTIHPLAMMTVSDGNLQNLQIGSTTNNATDPNDHEPSSSSSSAENVHSLSHTQGPHNRQIFSARNQTTKVDLAQRISPSPRSFFSTLSREKKAPLARDGWFGRVPFFVRHSISVAANLAVRPSLKNPPPPPPRPRPDRPMMHALIR